MRASVGEPFSAQSSLLLLLLPILLLEPLTPANALSWVVSMFRCFSDSDAGGDAPGSRLKFRVGQLCSISKLT